MTGSVPQPARTIDLWTAEVTGAATADGAALLAPWPQRHRVISTELFLASIYSPPGLHLLEITLTWPSWLDKAQRCQDLLSYWRTLRCHMANGLRPYGWQIADSADMELTYHFSVMERDGTAGYQIAAFPALGELTLATQALRDQEYGAALDHAVAALGTCHESQLARLIIGVSVFRHGIQGNPEVVADTAGALTGQERSLTHAIDRLSAILRDTKNNREHWGANVKDLVRRWTELREENADVFRAARDYLERGIF